MNGPIMNKIILIILIILYSHILCIFINKITYNNNNNFLKILI